MNKLTQWSLVLMLASGSLLGCSRPSRHVSERQPGEPRDCAKPPAGEAIALHQVGEWDRKIAKLEEQLDCESPAEDLDSFKKDADGLNSGIAHQKIEQASLPISEQFSSERARENIGQVATVLHIASLICPNERYVISSEQTRSREQLTSSSGREQCKIG